MKDNIHDSRWTRLLGTVDSIHPDVLFGKNVRIGEFVVIEHGCVIGDDVLICHNVVLREDTIIGNNTKLAHFVSTEPRAKIGNHVNLDKYTHVTMDCVIEDWVFMAIGSMTLNTKKISWGRSYAPKFEPPYIEYGARIGAHVTILPGIKIGREALVGAGSVVTKDCDSFGIYIGAPARKVGIVSDDERLQHHNQEVL